MAEAGAEDTGSNGYRRGDKEGGGEEGVWIQLGRRLWHLTVAAQSGESRDKRG